MQTLHCKKSGTRSCSLLQRRGPCRWPTWTMSRGEPSTHDPVPHIEINLQMAILNDAIMDACPITSDFDFGFDIDAHATKVGAMETTEAMASIPTPPLPSKRPTRIGFGKR